MNNQSNDELPRGETVTRGKAEIAPVPRLSIMHMMLWMLCTSVYVALLRLRLEASENSQDGFAPAYRGYVLFGAPINGAILTGAFILIFSRSRRAGKIAIHPGHYLLLVSSTFSILGYGCASLLSYLLREANGFNWMAMLEPISLLGYSITCGYVARHVDGWPWKIAFVGYSILNLFELAVSFFSSMTVDNNAIYFGPRVAEFMVSLWMAAVSWREVRQSIRRDWLHWLGIITNLGSWIAYFGLVVVFRIILSR